MANIASQRQSLALKLEALSESELAEVMDYISAIESTRRARPEPSFLDDEVLTALADARENSNGKS
jgi:hypothetical protein